MIRIETYLGGRLVKEIDQVDVSNSLTMRYEYIDGRPRWLLDGAEITEDEATILLGRDQSSCGSRGH
jgi:hypothetical protein